MAYHGLLGTVEPQRLYPPPMPTAAIYGRISLDRDGDAEGVERQVTDGEAWRRLEVGPSPTVRRNDRSAFDGKASPEWRRLLEALEAGTIDTVIAWANDRLYCRTFHYAAERVA
jgi:site-specific DNA recombinase